MTVLLLCSHGDSIVFVFSSSLRVSGLSPFMGDNDNETLSNVTSATWDFEDEAFDEISDNAKDFITNLLKKDMKWEKLLAEDQPRGLWSLTSDYTLAE